MENNNTRIYGGVSASGLLGVAFVILKLCGVIKWSWWWVTAPFWAPIALLMLFLVVAIVVACAISVSEGGK